MPRVTFYPGGHEVEVVSGTSLLEACRAVGLDIEAPCGGEGACGKCVVHVRSGDVQGGDASSFCSEAQAYRAVLSCRARCSDSALEIFVPEPQGMAGGKFSEAFAGPETGHEQLSFGPLSPLSRKMRLEVSRPRLEDGLSDLCRLTRSLSALQGGEEILCDISAMQNLAEALRQDDGNVTVTLCSAGESQRMIAVEAGQREDRHFGIAVDLGTTTVAVNLVRLTDGRILAARTDYNEQITCGLDVISRINYARKPHCLADLRERAVRTINRLIASAAVQVGAAQAEISACALSGNTTMVHLLLGLVPEYIRIEPYTPTVLSALSLRASEVGLDIAPAAPVCISPGVGSYVGGDITAGLLAAGLASRHGPPCLFIDIGTNGEIVIGNRDFLIGCACSAGPAFEGGGISCGMRAALGAIERVEVDEATGVARCFTIGEVPPKGICGSGMISVIAELYRKGWLDQAGKLSREKSSPAVKVDGRWASYTLVQAGEAEDAGQIAINETDIQNILRAKAAIYSACALMLEQLGIQFDDLADF